MPLTRPRTAARWIAEHLHQPTPPTVLVLGSGLGASLTHHAKVLQRIPYSDIPAFPRTTAPGHAGEVLLLRINHTPVLALCGRFHLYEGHPPHDVVLPVRATKLLGARRVILTNAAGALNPLFAAGSLMAITDQINLTGKSPLTGPNDETLGPRFPDMSQVYSPRLVDLALATATRLGLRLERGVYLGVAGPQLETPAETRMYRILGADAIGMSTVLEAIAARHLGMEVLGISCLTNQNLPDCMAETSIEAILAQAAASGAVLGQLLLHLIPALEDVS